MSYNQMQAAEYNALLGSTLTRYAAYPVAAGVNIVSNGAAAAWAFCVNWIELVAAGVVPNPCWLVGVSLGNSVVEAFQADIEIGTGAIGAEVALAIIPVINFGLSTNVGICFTTPIWLPYPVRIDGSPRVAANIRKSSAASAAGHNTCKFIVATALGT